VVNFIIVTTTVITMDIKVIKTRQVSVFDCSFLVDLMRILLSLVKLS
jgi:hypothetical protein